MTTQELLPRFKTAEKVMRSTGEIGLPTVRQNDLANASPVRRLFKTKLKGKDGDLISKHCLADGVCVFTLRAVASISSLSCRYTTSNLTVMVKTSVTICSVQI